MFFPVYTRPLFLYTKFWKMRVHNSVLFQFPELSLIHFKRSRSLLCDCSGFPRRCVICLVFASTFFPYGPHDGAQRSFRKSNQKCSCDEQQTAEVSVQQHTIFVQNNRSTDKLVLGHVMNGCGEWNMEPLIIPWG